MANGTKYEVKKLYGNKKGLSMMYSMISLLIHIKVALLLLLLMGRMRNFLPLSFLTTRNEFVKSWGEMITERKKENFSCEQTNFLCLFRSFTCIMHDHKNTSQSALCVRVYEISQKCPFLRFVFLWLFKFMHMRVEKRPFHDYPPIKASSKNK